MQALMIELAVGHALFGFALGLLSLIPLLVNRRDISDWLAKVGIASCVLSWAYLLVVLNWT